MSLPCYLLGAVWHDEKPQNQLPRFLAQGIWENGHQTKFTNRVDEIPVGAAVFIKASYYHSGHKEPILELRARGTVTANPHDGHTLSMQWDSTFTPYKLRESELAGVGRYRNTVEKVTEPTHLQAFLTGKLPPPIVKPEKQVRYLDFPRNQILYGPPGTGKTYHSVTHAVAIIEGKPVADVRLEAESSDEGRQQVRDRFAEYQEQGQIEFITFHQAFSYEDFVEGIKPKTVNAQVQYTVERGVFRRVSDAGHRARHAAELPASTSGVSEKEQQFEKTYLAFIDHLQANLAKGQPVELQTWKKKKAWVTSLDTSATIITTKHDNSPYEYNIGLKWMWLVYEKYATPESIVPMNEKMLEIGGPNASLQWALFKCFKEFEAGLAEGEDADEQPTPLELPVGGTVPRFVLIIDEINRGNIANIFGELITLLEEDKRTGKPEAITVRLPYSKLPFSVPDNLYLLGTMNTADRSVEALDTALRRRFSFTEMRPRPELLPADLAGVDIQQLLTALNHRLEQLLDHDHCLGHALLMTAKDFEGLREAFRRNILPLLQEYFFGDWGKIGLVLGDAFVEQINGKKSGTFALKPFKGYVVPDLSEKPVYRLVVPEDPAAFQAIYAA